MPTLVEALDFRQEVGEGHPDVLDDRLVFVQRRLLLQDADRVAGGEARFAVRDVLDACHDFQQRGLAHAVRAHDANLSAGVERKRNVVEDDLAPVAFAGLGTFGR